MHPNASRIDTFYQAFARRDADAMGALYHPDVLFSDPVFPDLRGDRARGMWRMLAGRARDLELTYSGVHADDRTGQAHWEARYTFTATGRRVHNVIDARFVFDEAGRIREHRDHFDLWRWSRQALGPAGWLLGWTPLLRRRIQTNAARGLDAFLAKG